MKNKLILMSIAILLFIGITFAGKIFETNNFGNFQIKQSAGTGKISVINEPGLYLQSFGSINTYRVSDELHFSRSKLDGGDGEKSQPIFVRFNGGSTGEIIGVVKFRLPSIPEQQKKLHRDFRSLTSVKNVLLRPAIKEALLQTATLMKAEESYSTKRSEFTGVAEMQTVRGIFETETTEITTVQDDGTRFIKKATVIKLDENGNPVLRKESPLSQYGIKITQFIIEDIFFDETIEKLIAKKREAEQLKVVAKTNAEKAKQDAITTREQGKASVAKAEAEALILQKTAVINAQKERKVAEEGALKALAEAKATKAKGEAEAYAARLKVKAGLTPREKAEFDMKTSIGVAEQLAKVKFPQMMVIGGSGKDGSALNPFDAVGLKSLIDISEDLKNKNK